MEKPVGVIQRALQIMPNGHVCQIVLLACSFGGLILCDFGGHEDECGNRHGFRVLIRVRAINIFEHWSAAWARSRFQRCLRPPCSFPDQRIRIGETAGKIIE